MIIKFSIYQQLKLLTLLRELERKLKVQFLCQQKKKFSQYYDHHILKKSREQFETRTHKRLIDILEPTPQTVEALMKLDLASGVDIEIKL